MNASLTYEILMYLNSFYFGMYAVFEIGIGVLKAINLNYGENILSKEAGILLALCFVETIRIILGRKSSLSDRGKDLCFKEKQNSLMFNYCKFQVGKR